VHDQSWQRENVHILLAGRPDLTRQDYARFERAECELFAVLWILLFQGSRNFGDQVPSPPHWLANWSGPRIGSTHT